MNRLPVVLVLLSMPQSSVAPGSPPIVSICYRGQPAGVPRAGDLALIHAQGFSAVTWPAANVANIATLGHLAHEAELTVIVPADSTSLTADSALRGDESVEVPVRKIPAASVAPLLWRALGHGTRVISLDAGLTEGTGLVDRQGRTPNWVAAAANVARQLRINGVLFGLWRPGPAVTIDPSKPPSLDVVLVDGEKSWVVIATNMSRHPAQAVVHLPASVPYALWLNLLTGSTMAMLSQPTGPQWNLQLEGWGVRIYVIDKRLK